MAEERKETKHVRDVMTPNPATVTEKDSIRVVAKIMARAAGRWKRSAR